MRASAGPTLLVAQANSLPIHFVCIVISFLYFVTGRVSRSVVALQSASPLCSIHAQVDLPPPPPVDDDDVELDEDDYALFDHFGTDIAFLNTISSEALDDDLDDRSKKKKAKLARRAAVAAQVTEGGIAGVKAGSDEDEEGYERKARIVKLDERPEVVPQLPVKTQDGDVVFDRKQSKVPLAAVCINPSPALTGQVR